MSLLLGAPDRRIEEKETTTWETNKIGGSPVRMIPYYVQLFGIFDCSFQERVVVFPFSFSIHIMRMINFFVAVFFCFCFGFLCFLFVCFNCV